MMQRRFQSATNADPKPGWLWLVATLCLLMICMVSTAQACHTHSDLLPANKDSHQNVPGPDHCPLCVAMHSAMPAVQHVIPEPLIQIHTVHSIAADAERIFRWRFELASRPPPVSMNRA